MGWQQSIFPLLIINAGGGFTGLFVYSPGPGAGNLIASIAAQSGTDPYGNAYTGPGEQLQNGGKLIVGTTASPQVQLLSNEGLTVTAKLGATAAAPTNVTSFSNLQNVVTLPSNNAHEASPAIIGQTLITYTNGSTADALLYLSGYMTGTGAFGGTFRLDISLSSDSSTPGCVIEGGYQISGSAITLVPGFFRNISGLGQTGIYNPTAQQGASGVPVNALAGFTDGHLFPANTETWHSVSAGNSWTGTIFYKMTNDNEVYLWSNNLTAPATSVNGVTIATLPSAYQPNVAMTFQVQQSVSGFGQRMTLSNTNPPTLQSTGVSASAGVSLGYRVPLDLP